MNNSLYFNFRVNTKNVYGCVFAEHQGLCLGGIIIIKLQNMWLLYLLSMYFF